jgi:hypothetical protein
MPTMLSTIRQPIYAAAHTPGYNHGCPDAQISDPSERYINQPVGGPSFHSSAFMQAYNEGFNACSDNSNSNSGSNDNSDFTSGNPNSASNHNSESSNIESVTGRMMGLCNKISVFLVQPCDTLVNSDDTLTQD